MSKAHFITPSAVSEDGITVRLGATNGKFTSEDTGKLVKLTAESRYDLCEAGDPIEGFVASVDPATSAGYSVGSIFKGRGAGARTFFVIADGLQATPGTGSISVGDYVVCGTVTAKNTALPAAEGYPRVCKATVQPGVAIVSTVGTADTAAAIKTQIDAVLVTAAAAERNALHGWRVESLGPVGTGAVGTMIAIVRV